MELSEVRSEKDLVQAVEQLRKKRLENRRPFEKIWWDNIALVAGDHYTEYDSNLATFTEAARDPGKVRLVLNQARVVARTELAKVMKSKPIFDVVPNSPDEEDIAATKVAKFALGAAEWQFKLPRFRKRAQWWTIITGCAGVYVGFDGTIDKQVHRVVIDPNTRQPTWNPDRIKELEAQAEEGGGEMIVEEWPLGDLDFKLYTPFQMLPDDTVFDLDEAKDIILTDLVEKSVAMDTWKDARLERRGVSTRTTLMDRMLKRAGLAAGRDQIASQDVIQVHSYWLPPGVYRNNPFLKNGIMVRWTDPEVKLEFYETYPYNDGRIPVSFFRHTPNATAIWPDTVITDIRDPNLELDKTMSQLLENRDYMLNPMWRVANQLNVQKIKSQPGGLVKYNFVRDVPPPEQLPGVPMPTQIENLVIGLRDQILDISGQGEVSRGRLPAGVRSGVQMSYLQEEDETKLGPVVDEFESALSIMGSLILSRMAQFYSTPRLLRNYRSGMDADVRKFKGADLRGNTDVQVQAGSMLPKLKAAKQQFGINMAELGLITDPKRLSDILELGEGEPDDIDLAFAQADRENETMRGSVVETTQLKHLTAIESDPMGDPMGGAENGAGAAAVPVKEWHNHEAHLKQHVRFMMTAEFERLTTTHPDIVRVFDEHVAMHKRALMEQQMQQMQMAMSARGGPEGAAPNPDQTGAANADAVSRKSAS